MGRRLTPPLLSPSLFSQFWSRPSPLFSVLQTPADASLSRRTSNLATGRSLASTKRPNAELRWPRDRLGPMAHLNTQKAAAPIPLAFGQVVARLLPWPSFEVRTPLHRARA